MNDNHIAEIPLTKGLVAIVDDDDYDELAVHSWWATEKGYAATTTNVDGRRICIHMHRMIMGLNNGDSRQVDHINGNRADNRRCNLRICTFAENGMNRGMKKTNKSGVKGVYFDGDVKKWRTQLEMGGQSFCVGNFNTLEEARDAIRKKRAELHGEFANHGETPWSPKGASK